MFYMFRLWDVGRRTTQNESTTLEWILFSWRVRTGRLLLFIAVNGEIGRMQWLGFMKTFSASRVRINVRKVVIIP